MAVLLALAWALVGTSQAGAAVAADGAPKRILFPIVGPVSYENDFGDPRPQGKHEGNDILASWRAPVVAVEAGRIRVHTTSQSAGCMLYLYGRSGATYLYIHLNNDLGPNNDNSGPCKPGVAYAEGLRDGMNVRAGQLIGYVGNSGDADSAPYHLHFELHPGDGDAVSPYPWLRKAQKLLFALPEPTGNRSATSSISVTLLGVVIAVEPTDAAANNSQPPASGSNENDTPASADTNPGSDTGSGQDPPPPPPPSDRAAAQVAAQGTLLTIRVSSVRVTTLGSWKVTKTVTLFVPNDVLVEDASGKSRAPAKLEPGDRLKITASAELSLDAQLGLPGALSAAEILLRG